MFDLTRYEQSMGIASASANLKVHQRTTQTKKKETTKRKAESASEGSPLRLNPRGEKGRQSIVLREREDGLKQVRR